MNERELLDLWNMNRLHIVLSQLAPTFLLIVTVWLMTVGLLEANSLVKFSALGILLASGILGALVQYSSATDAMAVAADVAALKSASRASARVVSFAPWLNVVRFVTPAIFVVIFILIASALLG